jgi:uridine kinase
VHTDDLLDGWADQFTFWSRLETGLLHPLRRGEQGSYRAYDWIAGRFGAPRDLDPPEVLILEGSTSARTPILDEVSFSVFVDAPEPVRLARALDRDGTAIEQPLRRWMRAENAHFAAEATRDRVDLVVDGAPIGPYDPVHQYLPMRTGRVP